MVDLAAAAIRHGAIVGIPTDTVYGLAVDPHQPAAVDLLFAAKRRKRTVPLIILVSTLGEAQQWGRFSDRAKGDARSYWPGALTVIVEAVVDLPSGVGDPDSNTIGLRNPDHPTALALLNSVGPLAVTSANLGGEAPASDSESAREIFGDAVGVYLPGGCSGSLASTVVDYISDPPVTLRLGGVHI